MILVLFVATFTLVGMVMFSKKKLLAALLGALVTIALLLTVPKELITYLTKLLPFVFFAGTLACIAKLHNHRLLVSTLGLAVIISYGLFFGFEDPNGPNNVFGFKGLLLHSTHEWVNVVNIFLLITGFDVVAHYFVNTHIHLRLPKILPSDWKSGLFILATIFVLSSVLDNIAAALIGGIIVKKVYQHIHVGFMVAIVMSSNAGGAGSVIGDTTTTMMWISGVSPLEILPAFIGSIAAFCFFAPIAARQQHKYSPIIKYDTTHRHKRIDTKYLILVVFILSCATGTNFIINEYFTERASEMPWIGIALWSSILLSSLVGNISWQNVIKASKSAAFLSCLILAASMMPIKDLPFTGSILAALGLGFISAFFDNIPLMALALKQNGYIPSLLAYCNGVGGSMTWFGSSAGVALLNPEDAEFKKGLSLKRWIIDGWFAPCGYAIGALAIIIYCAIFLT